MVEQRWGSKEDLRGNGEESENEKDREEEGSKDDSRESQKEVEERILSLTFC